MTTYPPGSYDIVINGFQQGFPDACAGTTATHTFTLVLEDPCSAINLTISSVAPSIIPPYYYDG